MKAIEFNYNPSIARKYVEEWSKQMQSDEKADERNKKIMQDIVTLCRVGFSALKKES